MASGGVIGVSPKSMRDTARTPTIVPKTVATGTNQPVVQRDRAVRVAARHRQADGDVAEPERRDEADQRVVGRRQRDEERQVVAGRRERLEEPLERVGEDQHPLDGGVQDRPEQQRPGRPSRRRGAAPGWPPAAGSPSTDGTACRT